jgi:tetratricopeptide (TPR) repeat protein
MQDSSISQIRILSIAIVLCMGLCRRVGAQNASPASSPRPLTLNVRPDDTVTHEGFERFYNSDYDAAIRDFEEVQKAHPDDPFATNHLLQAVLLRELDREGALSSRLYMSAEFLHIERQAVDPQVRARIEELTEQALSLAERRLKSKPDDAGALYARGVARALSATYEGLVEKVWFSALRNALGAYHDHKHVAELSPNNSDAKLVIGVYKYIVAALPFYEKIPAFLLTVNGSKSKGIDDVRQAANAGGETAVDAKTALSMFLAREQRYSEALSLMEELYRAFPHNFHFGLNEADLLRASSDLPAAVAAYRKLIALGQQGAFPHARLTQAAYGLGESLRSQGDFSAAANAFESADQLSDGNRAQAVQAKLSAGKMYDLMGNREIAIKKYTEVIAMGNDSAEAEEARRLLKNPFHDR